MKRKIAVRIGAFSVMFALLCGGASADDIKARMIQRLPVIEALKEKGIVGENNTGFLEFVGGGKEREDVVTAENQDRRQVYAAIAREQGTNPDVVGRHRAAQISQRAAPGEWLQDAAGKWYRKK
jgi:uncharacterized protein